MGDSPDILGPIELSDLEGREPFESFRDHKAFGDQMLFEDKKSFEDNMHVKDQMPGEDHKSLEDCKSFEDQKHLPPLHSNPSPSEQITTDIKAENSSESKDPMELSEEKYQKPFESRRSFEGRKPLKRKNRYVYSSTTIRAAFCRDFLDSRPLSPGIISELEEWHQKYPTRKPPYSTGSKHVRPCRIFDRQGREIKFAKLHISRPYYYHIRVLYLADGSQKLVGSIGYSKRWSFFIGWQGLEQGYESEVCAVQVYDIRLGCSSVIWETAPGDALLAKENTKASKSYRLSLLAPGKSGYSVSASESKKPDTPDKDESSDLKPWDGGDVSLPRALVAKKRKIDNESNSLPTKGPGVVFKLICDSSKASRAFTLHDACPGKELFTKARQFYQVSCPEAEVNILACRIPTSNEQRYLFDGSDDEVADFVREMKGLSRISGGTLLIEVEPQLLKS